MRTNQTFYKSSLILKIEFSNQFHFYFSLHSFSACLSPHLSIYLFYIDYDDLCCAVCIQVSLRIDRCCLSMLPVGVQRFLLFPLVAIASTLHLIHLMLCLAMCSVQRHFSLDTCSIMKENISHILDRLNRFRHWF